MNLIPAFITLLPILVILALLVWRRMAADLAGLIGWVLTLLAVCVYFKTPLVIALLISLTGVVASLPITIMVGTSLLQVSIMKEAGAIARIVALIKTIAPGSQSDNRVIQIMILNVGFGTILAAMGATPVSILPPIMLALGYSSFAAIALPAIGYDALCTYALLGIPVVVFSGFVGLPVDQVGIYFARFMPVISTCIALGMLWIVGGWKLVGRGWLPALIAGVTAGVIAIGMNAISMIPLTGLAAGLGIIGMELLYLSIKGQPLFNRCALGPDDLQAEKNMPAWIALSPWLILTGLAILVNAPFLPFHNLAFTRLAMPVTIIPGAPASVEIIPGTTSFACSAIEINP
jgi:lactate permease